MDLCRWERRCFSKYALSSCSCNSVVVDLATCWFLFVSVLVVSILRFAYLVAIFRIIEEVLTFSQKLARILVPCFRVGIWPTSGYSFSTWTTWVVYANLVGFLYLSVDAVPSPITLLTRCTLCFEIIEFSFADQNSLIENHMSYFLYPVSRNRKD